MKLGLNWLLNWFPGWRFQYGFSPPLLKSGRGRKLHGGRRRERNVSAKSRQEAKKKKIFHSIQSGSETPTQTQRKSSIYIKFARKFGRVGSELDNLSIRYESDIGEKFFFSACDVTASKPISFSPCRSHFRRAPDDATQFGLHFHPCTVTLHGLSSRTKQFPH